MKGQALNFDEISTKDLVRELTKREGISQIWMEPRKQEIRGTNNQSHPDFSCYRLKNAFVTMAFIKFR